MSSDLERLKSALQQVDATIKRVQQPTHKFTATDIPAMAPVTVDFTAGMRDAGELVASALGSQAGALIIGHLRNAQDQEEKAAALLGAIKQHLTLANLAANQGLVVLNRTIGLMDQLGR